jgi:hypothetical protein
VGADKGANRIVPVETLTQKREEVMRKLWKTPLVLCGWICTIISFTSTSASADTHVITATDNKTWNSEGQSSKTTGVPLVVEVKKGDTLEIRIPAGRVTHGFVTIDKKADENPSEAVGLVLACDQLPKPDAVLRETGCNGKQTNFGNEDGFTGTLKLEVLGNFKSDVNFWCVIHQAIMWGTIKLKP